MGKILLFAGTTEGREMAQYLQRSKIYCKVFVASEYGEKLVPKGEFISVANKRLNQKEIEMEIIKEEAAFVVDATHPFAEVVSVNISEACKKTGTHYIRLLRSFGKEADKNCIYVENMEKAVDYINTTQGKVFITTGSKDLLALTAVKNFEARLAVRILPDSQNLLKAIELGFSPANIICMQGPFSAQINMAMMTSFDAEYMLTKETGAKGGFDEKIDACHQLGVTPIVIGKPKEDGLSFEDVKKFVCEKYKVNNKKKVYIMGAGCGRGSLFTLEEVFAIRSSDLLISTDRILKALKSFNKNTAVGYKADSIIETINNSSAETISVLFSGDIGFFSGAKELRAKLVEADVESMSGISSWVYFMNKLGREYHNTKTISLHGRDMDFVGEVRKNESLVMLLGGNNTAEHVCQTLTDYGFGDIQISIGENLSYEDEKITTGRASELKEGTFLPLSLLLAENKNASTLGFGINEINFVRGQVPMTKSEVRAVSLSKLSLDKNAVVYDVGAGTGSVSIEMAGVCAKVYAVEKNVEAISLIEANQKKFGIKNIEIIWGEAPLVMESLPPPTHVFIGGSSGNIEKIIDAVFKKNPYAKIVINAIAMETIASIMGVLEKLNLEEEEICLLQVSKGKKLGESQMMIANNPVYIISFKGKEAKNE